jgi:hypothetical protein
MATHNDTVNSNEIDNSQVENDMNEVTTFVKKNYWKIALGAFALRGLYNTNPFITLGVLAVGAVVTAKNLTSDKDD